MVLGGRDVVREPLEKRRELLEKEGAAQSGRTAAVCICPSMLRSPCSFNQ